MRGQIRISGGLGDFISYCPKFEEFKKSHNIDNLHIYVAGGWENIPDLIIELAQPLIGHGLISSISKEYINCDYSENWEPDLASLKYKFSLPFKFPTFKNDNINIPKDCKLLSIQPTTTGGNFEGFIQNRYLSREDWIKICKFMKLKGYKIACLGGSNDGNYIPNELIDLPFVGCISIRECVNILNKSQFFIGCNSFMWEITSYSGIPTVCSYLTNYDIFAKIHVPTMESPNHGISNLRISTSRDVGEIIDLIEELLNG